MSRFFFFSLLILSNQFANAQNSSFFLVNLAIEESSILNQAHNSNNKDLLVKKLVEICNQTNGVIIDEYSDYFLVSDIYVIQSRNSNAGFLPVGSYKMNLTVKLIFKTGGKSFKVLNLSKEYMVNTESEAVRLLINDISFSEADVRDFFQEGFKTMTRFYSENCNSVIESAKKYQSIGEPEKALAISLSIPSDVPCYNTIAGLTQELYTSLSYKSDYSMFVLAQNFVSKGDYESAFTALDKISIYSQFYAEAQTLSKQINAFIFSQKELQTKRELADSEQELIESRIELQRKRNELQQSINQASIEIADRKNESDRQIAGLKFESQLQIKALELQSQERKEMIRTAGSLLKSYINRPQPPKNTNLYIIK